MINSRFSNPNVTMGNIDSTWEIEQIIKIEGY